MRRRSAPLWFELLFAVAVGLTLRVLGTAHPWLSLGCRDGEQVQYAFWGIFLLIAGYVWDGLKAAESVVVQALAWSVKALWTLALNLYNGAKKLGGLLARGLKESWEFLRGTYEHLLKPAWTKFWHIFDKFRKWLDTTFAPILRHLRDLRDALLKFWKTYVRPWLDLIDVTRRGLRLLGTLGVKWARELDRKLGDLEERIQRPFQLLLGKLNEVINVINRVVTLDGLLQRVALIRSLARDYEYAWNTLRNAYDSPLTQSDMDALRDANAPRTIAEVDRDVDQYVVSGSGPLAPLFDEMIQSVILSARAR